MTPKNSSPEMSLLILCAKLSHSDNDIHAIKTLYNSLSTYKKLLSLAYTHAMLPKLYIILHKYMGQTSAVANLKPYYMDNIQKTMLMSAQLIKLVQLLQSHDIPTLSFKGPILSQLLHNSVSVRQYGDLDVLIKKIDREKVIHILKERHFHPEIILHDTSEKTFFDAVNVLGFHTPKKDIFIEIHWELLSKNYAISWKEDKLWERTNTVYIDHFPIEALNTENHFLYLCTHGSKHLFQRLSWVCDIDHFIQTQKTLCWKEVIALAKELGILRMIYLSLNLCEKLFNTPLPLEVKQYILKDNTTLLLTKKIIDVHFSHNSTSTKSPRSFTLLLRMRENNFDKLKFIWHALFSPKFDDFKFVQLPFYLKYLYLFIRPLRLLRKYLN